MERKTRIQQCLQAFSSTDLRTAAIHLLNTLGYQSEKTLEIGNTREEFLAQFDNRDRKLRRDKALFDRWKSIDFLFRITDDEVRNAGAQGLLGFDSGYDPRNYQSYLFFALYLEQGQYTRPQLSRQALQEIQVCSGQPLETAMLSESALAEDWDSPEEDEAWKHL